MIEATGDGPPPRNVAIVMLTAVGDAVHVLPVVNSLRSAWPETRITWVIQRGPYGLVKGHPAVDEFVVFDRTKGWRGFREVWRNVRRREFDLVLALQDYLKAGIITAMIRAPRKVGLDRSRARDLNWLFTTERLPSRPRGHVQDQYLEYLDYLGVPTVLEWGLGPTDEERARYARLLGAREIPTAAIVVGTSNPEKEWPARRYATLIDRLHDEMGVRAIVVGGRSARENAAVDAICAAAAHPPVDLREWDLRRLVYLIDRADVLVAPDTGPLHVGVALGTSTVGLFGYTNPKRYGPYLRFTDLVVDGFGDLGEEYAAAEGRRRGRMERSGVDEVLAKVRLALERYPRLSERGQGAP